MKIKEKIVARILARTERDIHRAPSIPDLHTAKQIGILWQPAQQAAFQYLHKYFTRQQAIVSDLCITEDNLQAAQQNTITPKDLNWLGFPKSIKTENFLHTPFDILMNIATTQNTALKYITLTSNAKFKTGIHTDMQNYFDLSINIDQSQDALYFVKQQIFYLGQINNKQANEKTF